MTDWYGRTWHIFFGCLGVCIGTIITSMATSLPMFIAGRFLLSFFATCAHTAAPLYLVEIAPPIYRGTIAGMYNTFYNVVSLFLPSMQMSLGLSVMGRIGFGVLDIGSVCMPQVPRR
jgi:MFS family permease